LLTALARGDEQAWKSLFETFYPVMCHLAYQYLKDEDSAEAIVQDVISGLWEKKDTLSIQQSLKSYLFQAVRNRCLNHLKSFNVKNVKFIQPGSYLEDEVLDGSFPLGHLLESELETELESILQSLPQQTKSVFLKSREEGMSNAEIAREMGISENTVKYHIKKALAVFREAMRLYLPAIILFL